MNNKPPFKKRCLTTSHGNSNRKCLAKTKRKLPKDVKENESDEEARMSLRKVTTYKKRKASPKNITLQKKLSKLDSKKQKRQTSTKNRNQGNKSQNSLLPLPSKPTVQNSNLKQGKFLKTSIVDGFSTSFDVSKNEDSLKNTEQHTEHYCREPYLYDDFESQWSEEYAAFQNNKYVVKTYSRTKPYVIASTKSGFHITETEDIFSDQETEVSEKCMPRGSSGTNSDVSDLSDSCSTSLNLNKSIRTYSQIKPSETPSISAAQSDVPRFKPQDISNKNIVKPRLSSSKRSTLKKQTLLLNVEDETCSLKMQPKPYASTYIDSDVVKVYSKECPNAESQNISDSNLDVFLPKKISQKLQKQELYKEKKQAIKRTKPSIKFSSETPLNTEQRRKVKAESQNAALSSSPNVRPNNSISRMQKSKSALKKKHVNVRSKISLDEPSEISLTKSMSNTETLLENLSEDNTRNQTIETQISNPDALESNISSDNEVIDVVPQIKHVSKTYSRNYGSLCEPNKTKVSRNSPEHTKEEVKEMTALSTQASKRKSKKIVYPENIAHEIESLRTASSSKTLKTKASEKIISKCTIVPRLQLSVKSVNKATPTSSKRSNKNNSAKNIVPELQLCAKPVNKPKKSPTKLRKWDAHKNAEILPILEKKDETYSSNFEATNDKKKKETLSSSVLKSSSIFQQDDEKKFSSKNVVPKQQLGVKSVNKPKTNSPKPKRKNTRKNRKVVPMLDRADETYYPDFEESTNDKEKNENLGSSELENSSKIQQDDKEICNLRLNTKQMKQSKCSVDSHISSEVSESKDFESLNVQNSETQPKKKIIQHKKSVVSKLVVNNSSINDCDSSSVKINAISPIENPNQRKSKRVSASKPIPRKRKKVSDSKQLDNEQQTSPINSSTDATDFDFLPMIIESCRNNLKMVVSTADTFRRLSRRQTLTEKDFIKALAIHNWWHEDSDCDSVANKMDSKTDRDEENPSSIECQGQWLNG
ncbi:hypothetical protein JTE90_022925 [Oedothorax gibbosus]|uniref:Uncharacterized protein n=1 Tax=Oedothorax gibbosus TaxID=931172 RepID=A0AAV6U0Q7_9ARAC|nr:hypothetical protein JTE90_022925 [Oedothorax gibbosus]